MTEQYSHITQESRAAAADLASRILLEAGQS
jgi:hypothetical protein